LFKTKENVSLPRKAARRRVRPLRMARRTPGPPFGDAARRHVRGKPKQFARRRVTRSRPKNNDLMGRLFVVLLLVFFNSFVEPVLRVATGLPGGLKPSRRIAAQRRARPWDAGLRRGGNRRTGKCRAHRARQEPCFAVICKHQTRRGPQRLIKAKNNSKTKVFWIDRQEYVPAERATRPAAGSRKRAGA
jgi:hypothetical protein